MVNNPHTHTLNIGDERFEIEHNDKRLYKFRDWKTARESLIRILLIKLKDSHNLDDAYIEFKMANPMRRSRLGNFYISIEAEVSFGGTKYGTLTELGLDSISVDDYETVDESEIELRENVEFKFSSDQYNKELLLRIKSLEVILKMVGDSLEFKTEKDLRDLVLKSMELEGWSMKKDNRIHSRIKRLPKEINLNS